jgi:hypothetical protein
VSDCLTDPRRHDWIYKDPQTAICTKCGLEMSVKKAKARGKSDVDCRARDMLARAPKEEDPWI